MNEEHRYFRQYHDEGASEEVTETEARFSLSRGWEITDELWEEFLSGAKYKTTSCIVWAEADDVANCEYCDRQPGVCKCDDDLIKPKADRI